MRNWIASAFLVLFFGGAFGLIAWKNGWLGNTGNKGTSQESNTTLAVTLLVGGREIAVDIPPGQGKVVEVPLPDELSDVLQLTASRWRDEFVCKARARVGPSEWVVIVSPVNPFDSSTLKPNPGWVNGRGDTGSEVVDDDAGRPVLQVWRKSQDRIAIRAACWDGDQSVLIDEAGVTRQASAVRPHLPVRPMFAYTDGRQKDVSTGDGPYDGGRPSSEPTAVAKPNPEGKSPR